MLLRKNVQVCYIFQWKLFLKHNQNIFIVLFDCLSRFFVYRGILSIIGLFLPWDQDWLVIGVWRLRHAQNTLSHLQHFISSSSLCFVIVVNILAVVVDIIVVVIFTSFFQLLLVPIQCELARNVPPECEDMWDITSPQWVEALSPRFSLGNIERRGKFARNVAKISFFKAFEPSRLESSLVLMEAM